MLPGWQFVSREVIMNENNRNKKGRRREKGKSRERWNKVQWIRREG